MGEVFAGRYELVDLLGQGGMGSVWRTWDRRNQTYLAAKVLGQSDAASLLRFVREQALRIHHPHVVAPLGWAAEDDRVLFTMDIVTGGSVATLVGDHGPLPAAYAACLLDQLLSGLAAVHAAGVVHRDVKPANLLLQATGRGLPVLRLSDFGIAVHVDEPRLTSTGLVIGTRGYVPPEQLYGADPHPTQDLYAVGVVGAHLLTGLPPEPVAMIPAEPPAGVPADLWQLLRDLAAPRAADRPQSAKEAGRRLAATGLVPAPGEPLPWLVDPDPVEVFPQLPDLPPNWGPAGPHRRGTPAPVTVPGPAAPHAPSRAVSQAPGAAQPGVPRPTAAGPASSQGQPADEAPSQPVRTKVLPTDPDAPPAPATRDTRCWRRTVVPAVAAAAAAVAAIFLVPSFIGDGDGSKTPRDPSTSPTGAANSPAPTTRSTGPGGSPEWTYPVQTLSAGN